MDNVCVDSSTTFSFCRKMPRPSGLTTFRRFRFFSVAGARDTFTSGFSIVVKARAGIHFTPSIHRLTVDSASVRISAPGEQAWFPSQRRGSFQRARTQIRNLESFEERGCGMERSKDSDHAFHVSMLVVLMLVWLYAFVCICLSVFVCARLCLTACFHQCLAA